MNSIPKPIRGLLMRKYNRDYVTAKDQNIDVNQPPFLIAEVNLSTSQQNMAALIVKWRDSLYCGSGGFMLNVLMIEDNLVRTVLDITAEDVTLGTTSAKGVLDLWVDDNRFRWNGNKYERK